MRDSSFKRCLLKIWDKLYEIRKLYYVRSNFSLPIMTSEQTIDYIVSNQCSISRFGDGEFDIMLQRSAPGFQKGTEEMAQALISVFQNTDEKLLICLPRAMVSTKGFEPWAKQVWENWARDKQEDIVEMIRKTGKNGYVYGDSYVSRPYTAYQSRDYSKKIFDSLKELWKNRDILIVEGEKTRLGVGNDLFEEANSIKRILAPAENAFECYEEIFHTVMSWWNGELVILALGPTASVLASDLSKNNVQALDMGHIDIQYEWFLEENKSFTPVKGKYTNEALGGRKVCECEDFDYAAQIVSKIQKDK